MVLRITNLLTLSHVQVTPPPFPLIFLIHTKSYIIHSDGEFINRPQLQPHGYDSWGSWTKVTNLVRVLVQSKSIMCVESIINRQAVLECGTYIFSRILWFTLDKSDSMVSCVISYFHGFVIYKKKRGFFSQNRPQRLRWILLVSKFCVKYIRSVDVLL